MKIFSNLSFKVKSIFTKGPVREGGRNPYVDWTMILIVSSIITLTLLINGFYLFKRITNGDIQSKDQISQKKIASFDVSGLDSIILKFEEKENLSNVVKKGFQFTIDPSN